MNAPLASLSMYDWPETASALDRLWALIQANLANENLEAPLDLTRTDDVFDLWMQPEMLIGQTCGWPYVSQLRDRVIPFARIVYDLDCEPGHYYSTYIGQSQSDADYLKDGQSLLSAGKIAINGDDSQSGFHVYREITGEFSPDAIPAEKRLITGGHRNSVATVAKGDAPVAAIDAVAFELSKRHDPEYAGKVVIIGKSTPLPGLPLITSRENAAHAPALYNCVEAAISALDPADRDCLLIKGAVPAQDQDYNVFV